MTKICRYFGEQDVDSLVHTNYQQSRTRRTRIIRCYISNLFLFIKFISPNIFSARIITCSQNFLRHNITADRHKIRLFRGTQSPHSGNLPPANSTPLGAHLSRIRRIDCVIFINYAGHIYYFRPGAARLQTVFEARLASTSDSPHPIKS
jgi:hypothetical protein